MRQKLSSSQCCFCHVQAERNNLQGGTASITQLTFYMIFNYWRDERSGGVPVVQLSLPSPLQNICPSNVAAAPLSPREVACPAQDGQVCAGPGPSVIKRPSCAVTSGVEAGVIHDPVSAPSKGLTQTLTGQLRVKPRMEYL